MGDPRLCTLDLWIWISEVARYQQGHRQGGIVLDPFMGSGSTILACMHAGRKCVGIEQDEDSIKIAKKRAYDYRYL